MDERVAIANADRIVVARDEYKRFILILDMNKDTLRIYYMGEIVFSTEDALRNVFLTTDLPTRVCFDPHTGDFWIHRPLGGGDLPVRCEALSPLKVLCSVYVGFIVN